MFWNRSGGNSAKSTVSGGPVTGANVSPSGKSNAPSTAQNPLTPLKAPPAVSEGVEPSRSLRKLDFIESVQGIKQTISGGFQLAWSVSKFGSFVTGIGVVAGAALPLLAGDQLKRMIDAITFTPASNWMAATTFGATAVGVFWLADCISAASGYFISLMSRELGRSADTKVQGNLAARYEEIFSAANDKVVTLRENVWRIYQLPGVSSKAIAGIASGVAALVAFYVSKTPGPILGGSILVGALPALNQLFKAWRLHSDEGKIAEPRRRSWYLGWALQSKEGIPELNTLKAGPELSQEVDSLKKEINDYADKRDWGFMLREMFFSPGAALLTVGSTFYMWYLHVKSPSSYSTGDVAFVLTTTLPLLLSSIRSFGHTIGTAYESSPFFKVYQELSKPIDDHAAEIPESWRGKEREIKISNMSCKLGEKAGGIALLTNIDVTIPPGEFVAVAGQIGAGKTTLFELLCGLKLPTDGSIEVNGVKLSKPNRSAWASDLGCVMQDPFSFNSLTIDAFLRLGNSNIDDTYFQQVLQATGLRDLLDSKKKGSDNIERAKFPNGLETMLGEDFDQGVKLSAGQRQLLCIARALLRKPSVLLMDEPTANLNPGERERIRNVILNREKLMGFKPTVIMVSHDYKSIEKADRILFLTERSQGIAEDGTHQNLLQKDGLYAAEWKLERS